jgi:hypothetical protein
MAITGLFLAGERTMDLASRVSRHMLKLSSHFHNPNNQAPDTAVHATALPHLSSASMSTLDNKTAVYASSTTPA